jgi:hypothetical protein
MPRVGIIIGIPYYWHYHYPRARPLAGRCVALAPPPPLSLNRPNLNPPQSLVDGDIPWNRGHAVVVALLGHFHAMEQRVVLVCKRRGEMRKKA